MVVVKICLGNMKDFGNSEDLYLCEAHRYSPFFDMIVFVISRILVDFEQDLPEKVQKLQKKKKKKTCIVLLLLYVKGLDQYEKFPIQTL